MRAIGDNLVTVARSKRYTAKQFRELFLWAIGDRPDVPEGCEAAAEFIAEDQRTLDERVAKRRAQRAERQARWREQRDAGDAGDVHPPTNLPTDLPTYHVGNNASVIPNNAPAPARTPPKIETVLAWAADGVHMPDGRPIPDTFVREWYALMEAATPPWTNTRGKRITNWTQDLIYAWKREAQFNSRGGRGNGASRTNQPDGVVHHEEDYENPL